MHFYFEYNGQRFYSLKSFCEQNNVRYSSARYFLNKYTKSKQEIFDFLSNNPDAVTLIIDRYSFANEK